MRIVSGFLKGRTFYPPANAGMRPTTDIARESLFNILQNHIDIEDKVVLDLFSGTGAMSLEFISRGASMSYAVEKNPILVKFIKETSDKFGVSNNIKLVHQDAYKLLLSYNIKTDIIFADPPYDLNGIDSLPDMIFGKRKFVNENGLFILEHNKDHDFSHHQHFIQLRQYGKVNFSFFQ